MEKENISRDADAHASAVERLVKCPFCLKDNLDLIDLKKHLLSGFCNRFNNIKEKTKISHIHKRKRPKQWKCDTCGFIFTGGDPGGVWMEVGQLWCRKCNTEDDVYYHRKRDKGLMIKICT